MPRRCIGPGECCGYGSCAKPVFFRRHDGAGWTWLDNGPVSEHEGHEEWTAPEIEYGSDWEIRVGARALPYAEALDLLRDAGVVGDPDAPDADGWIIPPRCRGQIVERAYSEDDDYAYRRARDGSDGSTTYERARWSDPIDPATEEPTEIPESAWRRIDAADLPAGLC